MGILMTGLALMLRSDWTLVLLIPAAMMVHYGVVIREEELSGEQVRRSLPGRDRAAVPRYGVPWSLPRL